jgi:amino acid transporter
MTARECFNPRQAMPIATKLVFGRIFFFYIGTLFILGLVVPANDPNLASSGHGAKPSPLALAADLANIKGMAHYFNATIVLALVSMANASIFAASRTLQALCTKGMGPRAFSRVSKRLGVPIWSTMLCMCFGLLGFINCAPNGDVIFDWLLSISGTANYFIWAGICVSHIRFRQAWKARGRDIAELIWRSPFGVSGSVFGFVMCAFALFANVLSAIFPESGTHDAKTIVRENIGMLVPPMLYLGYILYYYIQRRRTLRRSRQSVAQDEGAPESMPYLFFIPLDEIDLDHGRLHNTPDGSQVTSGEVAV